MSNLLLDLRQTLRALLRSPGFTLPIVLVLGLGLGANVALHAILQTVLLRPLPVAERENLLLIKVQPKGEKGLWNASHPQFEDLKGFPGPFTAMTESIHESETRLRLGDRLVSVTCPMVGEGWFRTLGLRPSLGRTFTADEEATGAPVAVLSHRLWRAAFQGDPSILGRTVSTERGLVPFTVVGVGPAGFEGLELGQREDLWMPMKSLMRVSSALPPGFFTNREIPAFHITARLKAGATRAEGQAALDVASAALAKAHPESDSGRAFVLEGLEASEQTLLNRVLPQRTLLFAASGLALLLGVVSASGLFAARIRRREKEFAMRYALGASGGALARRLLLEALLLALMAAPVALASGLALARRLMLNPGQAASDASTLPTLDGGILALGLGLSLAALLLAALIPMLRTRRQDPAQILASRGGRTATSAGGGLFVATQVALSLSLLAASSVALGAFRSAAQMGYPTAHRAFMQVSAPQDPGLAERVLARLRAHPEVAFAARSAAAPLGGLRVMFGLRGGDRTEMEHLPAAMVGAGWFHALGVPLVEGRDFTDRDGKDKVILNETLARSFFPDGSAVGRPIDMGGGQRLEVVGVVADHRMRFDPDFHLPMIWLTHEWLQMDSCCLLVAGRGNARALRGLMKDALAQEKPGAEPDQLITLEDHVAATLHQEHQNLRLLGLLGMGSLVLACFGLWAALNLHVALRRRDMGIRAALGATAQHLLASVMGLGLRLLALGLGIGVAGVWALMRLVQWRWPGLPQIGALDLAFSAGTLLLAGLLACLLPALRAARVNPADVLRSE
ncbi:hypothetical protein GETHLI_19900 [Geothrix limicola]|uniref:FtsX-like permease family protein n=1 Tax=Geothrix limicola TaxID=2927978 RepID=A0ABQ5QFY5_9BACT|nr:ABC transporter permease [Geothrix limicola]GLH73488.1 hypothetical protein GETHLI_19900 [Geothrix limicola]